MLLPFFLATASALLFYVIFPVAGAFRVRARWRRFRNRVIAVHGLPPLHYRDVARGLAGLGVEAAAGGFTLRGVVDAFEGEQLLWIRGDEVSAAIDFRRSPLYVLAPEEDAGGRQRIPAGTVESTAWSAVRLLSEGTKLFVGGTLTFGKGKPAFVEVPGAALVAIAYDCPEGEFLRRVIAGARHRNEYWNPWTRISLILGIVVGSVLYLTLAGPSPFPTVRILAFLASASPVLPLFPPGLFLFFLYRRWWRKALERRIERDFAALHASGAPVAAASLSRRFARRATNASFIAGAFLVTGVLLNAVILFHAWRSLAG